MPRTRDRTGADERLGFSAVNRLDAELLKEPLVRTPAFRPAPEELAIEYVDWSCPSPNSRYGVSPFGYQGTEKGRK